MTQQPSPKASKRQIRRHLAKGAARRAGRFGRDESGVMIAYSIFFLLIMLIVGGIGVDFMHYEMSRTRLQNTLDRAVLAAADMQQTQDPVAVVEDYLAKAGVDAQLTGTPVVNTGLNYRDVAASATLTVPTQFIHMLGFNSLTAPGAAKAEEKIEAIEIALVLDVSGSMNSNNRLINLKPAAREFIDAVMDLTEEGDVSVSLIPYNTQVSAGPDLLKHYSYEIGGTNTITTLPSELGAVLAAGLQNHLLTPGITQHDYSHCVNFDAASFGSTTIPTNVTLEQTMHFDMFSYAESTTWPPVADTMPTPLCNTSANADIMVMSTDDIALKNRIDDLVAGGNTSIDIGMKWAANLLDPATRPVIADMIADGDVSADNTGRPLDWDAPDSLKVIVVMTDGQNTNQYMMPEDKRLERSNVWFSTETGRFSIYNPGRTGSNKFFYPHNRTWNAYPSGYSITSIAQGTLKWLHYYELWAMESVAQNAWYLYGPMYQSNGSSQDAAWTDWYSNLPDIVSGTEKDARLQSICNAVKDDGVVVYAIGFEATANGNAQLRNCASSPSHFFSASGVSIRDTFQAIAVSIAQLRLTQ